MIDASKLQAAAAALPFGADPAPRRRDDWSTRTVAMDVRVATTPATPFKALDESETNPVTRGPTVRRVIAPNDAGMPFFPRPSESSPAAEVVVERALKSVAAAPELLALNVYVAIRIELWKRNGAGIADVLGGYGLSEVEWLAHEQRYVDAIDRDAQNGRAELAMQVARAVAEARGPLGAKRGPTRRRLPA